MSNMAKVIRAALDHDAIETDALVTKKHADDLAQEIAAALGDMGYVLRKAPKPRKPTEPDEVFDPVTGDAALDEFMRNHHDPNWKRRVERAAPPFIRPGSGPGKPPKLTAAQYRDEEHRWVKACTIARNNRRLRDDAADILREVISIHRPQ